MYEDLLLNAVTDILLENLDATLGRYALALDAPPQQEARRAELKEKITAKQQERGKICERNRGLYESLTLGLIDRDVYFSLRERYTAQAAQIEDELRQLNEGLVLRDEQLKQYQSLKKDARSIRKDRALTAELIDRLIERVEVAPDKHITVRFKFQSEFERCGEALEQCGAL